MCSDILDALFIRTATKAGPSIKKDWILVYKVQNNFQSFLKFNFNRFCKATFSNFGKTVFTIFIDFPELFHRFWSIWKKLFSSTLEIDFISEFDRIKSILIDFGKLFCWFWSILESYFCNFDRICNYLRFWSILENYFYALLPILIDLGKICLQFWWFFIIFCPIIPTSVINLLYSVWKSQKKSHSTLRANRATFTFWVDKS